MGHHEVFKSRGGQRPAQQVTLHGLAALAAQESQGFIHDRSREFLATSDKGVVMWRKLVFDGIKAVANGGDPHGIVRDAAKNDLVVFDAGKNFSDHEKALASAR